MKKLCVIFGGASVEHDISIITGIQLCKNYNKDLEKIYMGLDNKFYLATKLTSLKEFENKNILKLKEVFFFNGAVYSKNIFAKKLFEVECVINCCHGGVGENGDLNAYFQINQIKSTSAKTLSAHIAMDKTLAKTLVENVAKVIKGVNVTKQNYAEMINKIETEFSNSLIVKPNSLGSSIGVKACDKTNYKDQIQAIFEMNDTALVEERIVNLKEYNQACLKTKDGLLLSSIEQPLSKNDFLTFEDKYKTGKTKGRDREIPAKISPELEEEIISNTQKIYELLNMNGVVRIDYILDAHTNTLYFNEINTIPGSMAYYLFESVGVDYITLINKIVENALEINQYKFFPTDILKDKNI